MRLRSLPQQEPRSNDCGIFVVTFTEALVDDDLPFHLDGSHMERFRARFICALCQLRQRYLASQLSPPEPAVRYAEPAEAYKDPDIDDNEAAEDVIY